MVADLQSPVTYNGVRKASPNSLNLSRRGAEMAAGGEGLKGLAD